MRRKRQRWTKLCMMLAELWHLGFEVRPFKDFLKSGMWSAEFHSALGTGLPLTGVRYGRSVEDAAKKLVRGYICRYGGDGRNGRCSIRSEEELLAKYEFAYGVGI